MSTAIGKVETYSVWRFFADFAVVFLALLCIAIYTDDTPPPSPYD